MFAKYDWEVVTVDDVIGITMQIHSSPLKQDDDFGPIFDSQIVLSDYGLTV